MPENDRCPWPTGTVWTGPEECGRPVKGRVRTVGRPFDWPDGLVVGVCGIHRNTARRNPPGRARFELVEDVEDA